MYSWARSWHELSSSIAPHIDFWGSVMHRAWALLFQPDWLVSKLRPLPHSIWPPLRCTDVPSHMAFYMKATHLDSCFHFCIWSTFPSYVSPPPSLFLTLSPLSLCFSVSLPFSDTKSCCVSQAGLELYSPAWQAPNVNLLPFSWVLGL